MPHLVRAFTWALDDEDWKARLGILLLLSLVPGLNLIALTGYSVSIAHNIVRGATRPLPAWGDWIDILVRGLMALVASAAWFLPLALVLIIIGLADVLTRGLPSALFACLVPLGLIYSAFALAMLAAGHVRYARSDQYTDYYQVRRRFSELRNNLGYYVPFVVLQVVLTSIALVLFIVLSPTLLGGFAAFCALSVANGYQLGMLARNARRR
jgi:hypothetical protein